MSTTNIVASEVRAKAVYMEDTRLDKNGREHRVRQHVMPMEGMYSAKEAERVAIDMARDLGVDESRMRVETYQLGDAPMTANPRHRGVAKSFDSSVSKPQRVNAASAPLRSRRVFGGMGIPQTPEEWADYVAAFEARKAAPRH